MSDPINPKSSPEAPAAQEAATDSAPAGVVTETSGGGTTPPPSARVPLGQPPLVVDVLGVGAGYGTLNTEYLAKKIDSYVLEEMKLKGVQDTKAGYKEVVDAWVKALKLPAETDIYTKLERLKEYGYLNAELRDKLNERDNLLAGDPMKMTSTQLRKYLLSHGA